MLRETQNSPIKHPPIRIFNDPYLKLRIDSKDHDNIIMDDVKNFTRSVTCDEQTNNQVRWVGLWEYNSNKTADLTKTFTLPTDGYYQIEVESYCHPRHTGSFQLYDGTTAIEDLKSCQQSWSFQRNVIYKPHYYTAGSHTFKFSITSMAWLGRFIITPLIRYEGDNEGTPFKTSQRIDFKTAEWTENSVSELNVLTLNCNMHEDYWRKYDWYNPLQFDLSDIVTLWAGEKRNTTQPVFGGYVTGYSINDGSLELRCIDRLWDLNRTPIYQNFSIGSTAAPEGSTRPFTNFPTVYSLATFLATTGRHHIPSYNIPHDYGLFLDFSNSSDFNQVSATGGFSKYWDTNLGPSIRVNLNGKTGDSTLVLYNEITEPYDAYNHGMFSFDYYAGGTSTTNPIKFNLHIDMHPEGSTYADRTSYTIYFTDTTSTESNVIGSVKPILNGTWKRFTVNLKDWFDNHAPSIEYNISKVWLEGSVTSSDVANLKDSSIYLTRIFGYKNINHSPKYASQDVKTRYEELRQVCERTDHVAYVEYADSRPDDVLVVLPAKNGTCAGTVDEKNNLISLDSLDYNPLDNDFCNSKHITFNFDENNSGSSIKTDYDSTAHYGYVGDHEFDSEIDNQTDADQSVNNTVTNNSFHKPQFRVTANGYSEVQPLQYVTCNLPKWRITGNHEVKSITRHYENNMITSSMDMNQPSDKFRNILLKVRRDLDNISLRDSRTTYLTGASTYMGLVSSGAFTQ